MGTKENEMTVEGKAYDGPIKEAFMRRADISALPSDEQEVEWIKQLEATNKFINNMFGDDAANVKVYPAPKNNGVMN